MNIRILCCVAGILAVGAMQDKPVPAVDHHQHLYNPALGPLTLGEPVTADDLVKLLDQAGIRKAVLFSIAYQFGNPNRPAIANDLIVARIRQIGIDRILYGSDGAAGPGRSPREAWQSFTELPLSDAEIRTVAGNVAPYMR